MLSFLFLPCFLHSVLVHLQQVSLEIVSLQGYAEHFNILSVLETVFCLSSSIQPDTDKHAQRLSVVISISVIMSIPYYSNIGRWFGAVVVSQITEQKKIHLVLIFSFKSVCFMTRFFQKSVFYCSKQHPQTPTKLLDFQKTETKCVSGEEKKRSALI